MITFEKIRWKNFLSTGNHYTNIQFNNHATTLIVGTNGAGKSTVLDCLLYTSPSPRDRTRSRMPSSA